jgi:hypothetical protein
LDCTDNLLRILQEQTLIGVDWRMVVGLKACGAQDFLLLLNGSAGSEGSMQRVNVSTNQDDPEGQPPSAVHIYLGD